MRNEELVWQGVHGDNTYVGREENARPEFPRVEVHHIKGSKKAAHIAMI